MAISGTAFQPFLDAFRLRKLVYENADLDARRGSFEVPRWYRVCARL